MTRSEPCDGAASLYDRLRARIAPNLPATALDTSVTPPFGDHSLNDWAISAELLATVRVAAVLIGVVDRESGPTVLLTQRTAGLRDHAGQIAFPGGKMDPGDASPAAAAIREAREEVGLPPSAIELIGYLDPYLTRTGFRIVPVIARLKPPFDLVLNPAEVVDAFEVPFGFLMDEANHQVAEREWQGITRYFYSIAHDDRTIWGATAGILRVLYERLYL